MIVRRDIDLVEGSMRFKEIVWEIMLLHERKQRDYGNAADPFANVRASEDFGVPGWKGALIRLNDKVTRLKNYSLTGTLANESVEDSLMDMAVYAIIALCLYREGNNANGG